MIPKVSVIVPIYNVEEYLENCLCSIINQTLKEIEIILVDDGSPDRCPEICDNYALKDSRIKVIHKKNAGLGYARNSGLNIAQGEFIAFVDSDDFVEVNMFERLYEVAKDYQLDTVYCGFNQYRNGTFYPNSEVDGFKFFEADKIQREVLMNMIASLPEQKKERTYYMSVWHAIYSAEIIKSNGILFPSERDIISEDIIFDIDYLLNSKRLAYIPDCLYNYRCNNQSLSKKFRRDRNVKIKYMYESLIQKANDLGWDIIDVQRIMRMFIGYSRNAMIDLCRSDLKFIEKCNILKEIISDKIWEDILDKYPYKKLPLKYAIYTLLIKYKQILLIYLVSRLK